MLDAAFPYIELFVSISVIFIGGYYTIFSLASVIGSLQTFAKASPQFRMAILIPIGSELTIQNYPNQLFTVVYYTDLPKSISNIDESLYDICVVLGEVSKADNLLLKRINNAFAAGAKAIKLHHIADCLETSKQFRAAKKEEIRNSIFNLGHNKLGISSSLGKVDYAVDAKWLKANLTKHRSNIENRLLHQEIYIYYLPNACIYSDSVRPRPKHFSIIKAAKLLPQVTLDGNLGYVDKLLRSFFPSLEVMFYLFIGWCIFTTYIDWVHSFKWWFILFIFGLVTSMAIPDYCIRDKRKQKSKNSEREYSADQKLPQK